MEPSTAIELAGYAKEAYELIRHFLELPTERFKERRDREQQAWLANVAHRSSRLLAALSGQVEDIRERVNETLSDPQLQVVAALYADAAYREAIDERRKMLEHATATIVDPTLSVQEKARIERVLRELDPIDVMCLYGLSRSVSYVRVVDGKLETFREEAEMRFRLWAEVPSAEGLASTSCVRLTSRGTGTWGDQGMLVEQLQITNTGKLLLRVLRTYTATRSAPFDVPGREVPPETRTSEETSQVLGDFGSLVRIAARSRRMQFDVPKPFVRDGQVIVPRADAPATMHFPEIEASLANRLAAAVPAQCELISNSSIPDVDGKSNIAVRGPWDLLRWLADDIDARWT